MIGQEEGPATAQCAAPVDRGGGKVIEIVQSAAQVGIRKYGIQSSLSWKIA